VASKVLLRLLDGIFNEHFDSIKNVKNVTKRLLHLVQGIEEIIDCDEWRRDGDICRLVARLST